MQAQPQLVMLPGWGFKASIFCRLSRHLRPQCSVSMIDLCYDPAGTATSLSAVTHSAAALAPPRAIWLGWSLGGLVALSAAALLPERVAGVILLASTPRFLLGSDWPCGLDRHVFEQFRALLARDPQRCLNRFMRLVSEPDTYSLRQLREHLTGTCRARLQCGLDILEGADLRSTLRNMYAPGLALWGEHDAIVSAESAHQVQELAPGLRSCMIPLAGHAPFVSHPETTAAAIVEYLHEFH